MAILAIFKRFYLLELLLKALIGSVNMVVNTSPHSYSAHLRRHECSTGNLASRLAVHASPTHHVCGPLVALLSIHGERESKHREGHRKFKIIWKFVHSIISICSGCRSWTSTGTSASFVISSSFGAALAAWPSSPSITRIIRSHRSCEAVW